MTINADAMAAVLVAVIGVFGLVVSAVLTHLSHRVDRLEGKVTRLSNLAHRWWEWGQKATVLYHTWRREGAPDLPPVPIEDPEE